MSDSLVENEVKMTDETQSIKAAAPHLRALIILVEMWGHNLKLSKNETPSACGVRKKNISHDWCLYMYCQFFIFTF